MHAHTSIYVCIHSSTPAFITHNPTVGGDGGFGGWTVPAPLIPSIHGMPQQERLEHAEDRNLEKEEPGEDGGQGTAEDCGGL